MCGIGGIVSAAGIPSLAEAALLRDALAARGPDGEGLHAEGPVVLVHRRLAIIDRSARSDQPMRTADGRYAIVFNGEIYNHASLRERLIAEGRRFVTAGDTEVILQGFVEYGERIVTMLEGMFAFAIWDRETSELFLARDPHGIKPLYVSDEGGVVRFASSVKALAPQVSREIDETALLAYLAWGYVPDPWTLRRAIRSLPAGSVAWVRSGRLGPPKTIWSVARAYRERMVETEPLDELVRRELLGSAHRHLIADVEVGLFLSAGVDSGALLGLATEARGAPLRTTTLGFGRFRETHADETPLAAEVARHYGAHHTTSFLEDDDVFESLPAFLEAMDQPTNDALNTYLVARETRRQGLVCALSGLGGDELFGGYATMRRFRRVAQLRGLTRHLPTRAVESLLAFLPPSARAEKVRYAPRALGSDAATYLLLRGVRTPAEVAKLVGETAFRRAGGLEAILAPVEAALRDAPTDAWRRSLVAEQTLYMRSQLLRDSDWATMAHGLELRVPLVDRRVTETVGLAAANYEGHGGKQSLARSPRPRLPAAVFTRPKTGFATPMQAWTLRAIERAVVPHPTKSLLGGVIPSRAELVQRVREGSLHWSRAWTLPVLAHQLEG